MEQIGKIIEIIDNNTVKVNIQKHTSCKNCGACHIGTNPDIAIIADNQANAGIGNIVEVSMQTQSVLSAAFIMYVIPLFILVVSIAIGTKFFRNENGEVYSILMGLFFLALSYYVIRQNEKKFRQKYKAVITKIIE